MKISTLALALLRSIEAGESRRFNRIEKREYEWLTNQRYIEQADDSYALTTRGRRFLDDLNSQKTAPKAQKDMQEIDTQR